MRIDAHQHFWKIARGDYFWMGPAVAPLCRDYLPPDLEPELVAQRIDGTVAVQAAPTLAETEFLLELADASPRILGVVGWVDFESDGVAGVLERLARRPKFVGVRPMLQDLPDDAWILRPRVIEGLGRLAALGRAFDCLVFARHLPHVCRALELVPDLCAVIDHCAKPDLRGGDLRAWRDGLRRVAEFPNVFCKISGLVTEADPKRWTSSELAPAMEHALAVFGEDRVVFGSDWPVCTLAASYAQVIGAVEQVLGAQLSNAARDKFFGENARRLYGL